MDKFESLSVQDLSVNLRKRFCKDNNIPIKIYELPYFLERIKLLHPYYDTYPKLARFLVSLWRYDCEQDYFEDYNRIKDAAIKDIKNSAGYKLFNEENMNLFKVPDEFKGLPGKDIFHPSNDGKSFISIDMRKANFSSLRYYDPEIFDGAETWEEFIAKYTDNDHIIQSKYIRQVILGNCNPKRHITYEKYIMSKLLPIILQYVDIKQIVFFSNDEIVIDVKNDLPPKTNKLILNIGSRLREIQIPFKIEKFTLRRIPGLSGYYKEFADGKIEFKSVSSEMIRNRFVRLQPPDLTFDIIVIVKNKTKPKPIFLSLNERNTVVVVILQFLCKRVERRVIFLYRSIQLRLQFQYFLFVVIHFHRPPVLHIYLVFPVPLR